jgi:hypothetical protein
MSTAQPGPKSFLFYCALLVVCASSVTFGLDWTAAPLPPMPENEATVQAAKLAANIPPPVVRAAAVEPKSVAVVQPKPVTQQPQQVAVADPSAKVPRNVTATPSIIAAERTAAQPDDSAQPKCDIDACSTAYRSFRASDCSWQPFDGPRRFCDKGNPPQNVARSDTGAADTTASVNLDQPVVSNKCDIEACKRAYFTFTSEDCTYQPSDGPRRLCSKGNPPKPDSAKAEQGPAADASNKIDQANANKVDPSEQAKPKCNIDACRQAFFSFTPEDCTYQPINGPRRLCTK